MDSEVKLPPINYAVLAEFGDRHRIGYNVLCNTVHKALREVPAALARPSAAGDAVDIYEGHAENCHAVHPGDRECNCHKAYGFDPADAMYEADQRATAPPVAVSDARDALDGDELYRLLAQVGPVGTFNGKDVIYRSSVLELVKRRIDALTGAQP